MRAQLGMAASEVTGVLEARAALVGRVARVQWEVSVDSAAVAALGALVGPAVLVFPRPPRAVGAARLGGPAALAEMVA